MKTDAIKVTDLFKDKPEDVAWAEANPYIGPEVDNNINNSLRPGLQKVEQRRHVAVAHGAAHKCMKCMRPIHDANLDRVDGHAWELFAISHDGEVDGRKYLWGMFVLGIGAFNVMAPLENTRELTDDERDRCSKQRLQMVGSHTGNVAGEFGTGVAPAKRKN